MKLISVLAKEGSGVPLADDAALHPLPFLPLRRGVIFRAGVHARPLTGTQKP